MACSRLARRQTSSLSREPSIASDADSPSRKMKDFHVEDFDMIKTIGTGETRTGNQNCHLWSWPWNHFSQGDDSLIYSLFNPIQPGLSDHG